MLRARPRVPVLGHKTERDAGLERAVNLSTDGKEYIIKQQVLQAISYIFIKPIS